jgi:hypothetical protein
MSFIMKFIGGRQKAEGRGQRAEGMEVIMNTSALTNAIGV